MQKKAIECNTEFPYRIIKKGLSFQNTTKTRLALVCPSRLWKIIGLQRKNFFELSESVSINVHQKQRFKVLFRRKF